MITSPITVSMLAMVNCVMNVATIKTVKILVVFFGNGEKTKAEKKQMNKNGIDAIDIQAEREGVALRKQGRYRQSRWYYIREQTSDYNKEKLDKVFRG